MYRTLTVIADSAFSACVPALIDGAERDRGLRESRIATPPGTANRSRH